MKDTKKLLTNPKLQALQPKDKPYKVIDKDGLVVLVHSNGSKYFRYQYRFEGKQKTISFGSFPTTSLKEARKLTTEARAMLNKGINPMTARKEKKRAGVQNEEFSFKNITKDWLDSKRDWSDSYRKDVSQRLNSHVVPIIGNKLIAKVTKEDLNHLIKRVGLLGLHSATIKKIHQHTVKVFDFGIAKGACDRNTARDMAVLLPRGDKVTHRAALSIKELPLFLNTLDSYQGRFETIQALKLLILTAARPGEVQKASWQEIDLKESTWLIPSHRMKTRKEHLIPLPTQAITILSDLQRVTGHNKYLFPNQLTPKTYMSENTLNIAIKRMGFDATAHGMRSVFSSLMNEQGYNPDAIETQLSHNVGSEIRRVYNRSKYFIERKELVQAWADWLDEIKKGNM